MAFPTCTEASLSALIDDCLQCVNRDDLTAFRVRLLMQLTGVTAGPAEVSNALCVACHSDLDIDRMVTALWAELAVAKGKRSSWNVAALRDETKCFKCTDPHKLRAAEVLLLCTYLKSL